MIFLVLAAAFFFGRLTRVFQAEPLTGLGDVVALATATLFISATGNCGCRSRRERWNLAFPLPRRFQKRGVLP